MIRWTRRTDQKLAVPSLMVGREAVEGEGEGEEDIFEGGVKESGGGKVVSMKRLLLFIFE
jgi:hypothetical protein